MDLSIQVFFVLFFVFLFFTHETEILQALTMESDCPKKREEEKFERQGGVGWGEVGATGLMSLEHLHGLDLVIALNPVTHIVLRPE